MLTSNVTENPCKRAHTSQDRLWLTKAENPAANKKIRKSERLATETSCTGPLVLIRTYSVYLSRQRTSVHGYSRTFQ